MAFLLHPIVMPLAVSAASGVWSLIDGLKRRKQAEQDAKTREELEGTIASLQGRVQDLKESCERMKVQAAQTDQTPEVLRAAQEKIKQLSEELNAQRINDEAMWKERFHELRLSHEEKNAQLQIEVEELKKKQNEMDPDLDNFVDLQNRLYGEMHTKIRAMRRKKRPDGEPPKIGFVGQTSSGKSSLVNALYGLTCATGADQTTMGVDDMGLVENGKYTVLDIFGYNDEKPYYTRSEINTFLGMKLAVLCYENSIYSCKRAIELFNSARVRVIAVRTKWDTVPETEKIECERVGRDNLEKYGDELLIGSNLWAKVSKEQPETLHALKKLIVEGGLAMEDMDDY